MPQLLVDGYNVMHAWPKARALIDGGLDAAASVLVERLRVLNDFGGRRVAVIFDGKGQTLEVVQERGRSDVEVIYSPANLSADAIIEQIVCRAQDPSDFIVASRDNMVRETVFALGASVVTPEKLLGWIEDAERKQTADILRRQKDSNRSFGNRLFDL